MPRTPLHRGEHPRCGWNPWTCPIRMPPKPGARSVPQRISPIQDMPTHRARRFHVWHEAPRQLEQCPLQAHRNRLRRSKVGFLHRVGLQSSATHRHQAERTADIRSLPPQGHHEIGSQPQTQQMLMGGSQIRRSKPTSQNFHETLTRHQHTQRLAETFPMRSNAHVEVRLRRRLTLRQQRSATSQTSPPTCC